MNKINNYTDEPKSVFSKYRLCILCICLGFSCCDAVPAKVNDILDDSNKYSKFRSLDHKVEKGDTLYLC